MELRYIKDNFCEKIKLKNTLKKNYNGCVLDERDGTLYRFRNKKIQILHSVQYVNLFVDSTRTWS